MRKTLLLMTTLLLAISATADNVSQTTALRKAQAVMPRQAKSLKLVDKAQGESPAWYAFAADKQQSGFIIMAGDDRVSQVLGYSDEGTFDKENMPESMKWWLKGCEEQIELLRQGKAEAARIPASREAVAPLVTSKWGQDGPFNLKTPLINGHHAPTGCMPTAMAQILYYWKSQAGASAIDAYTTSTQKIKMPALPATTFNYSLMQDEYDRAATGDAADEVAKLMLYCGQAFNVDYNELESGASGGSGNFVKSFNFDIHGFDLRRIYESREQWDEALYAELAAGRPIFMSGLSYQVGHGWVVDGYDGQGLFHVNWGWYGSNNGWYVMDVARAGDEGQVDYQGEGYTIGQIASIGLQPASDDISHDDMALSISSIETDAATYTRSSADQNFTIKATAQINNYYGATLTFNHAAAIYTTDGQLVATGYTSTTELQNMYGGKYTRPVSFGAGIENGTYILKMVSRLDGQETWNPDQGSYRHYVELTIDGNTLTATPVTNPFTKELTINSMEVVGTSKIGKETTLKFNATNSGTYYINTLYVMVDNTLASAIGVPFNPGETGDFYLHYTPSSPGTKTIQLRTSRYNANSAIWSGSFEVSTPSEPDLTVESITVTGGDLETGELKNDIWRVVLDVKNNANEVYDGVFETRLWKYDEASQYFTSQKSITSDVVINAGETAQVVVSFDDVPLEIGGRYYSRTSVYKPSAKSYTTLKNSPTFTVTDVTTGIASVERQPGEAQNVFSISGQRVGNTADMRNLPSGLYIVGGKKYLKH